MQGMGAAMGSGQLDRAWFDALCRNEEEVDEAQSATNQQRFHAEAMAKRGLSM